MHPWFGRKFYVANAGKMFDEQGNLTDEQVRAPVASVMAGFAEFVQRSM